MGIETDPIGYEYGNNCLACWAPGLTPKNLVVDIEGVTRGALWAPGMPDPPNGRYLLTQGVIPCQWLFDVAGTVGSYHTGIPGSQLLLYWFAVPMFLGNSGNSCVFSFTNTLTCPTNEYCGGRAIVFQLEPIGGVPSITDIMELINMKGRPSRKTEIFPLDNQHLVAMFADLVESTRIRIKYDFT